MPVNITKPDDAMVTAQPPIDYNAMINVLGPFAGNPQFKPYIDSFKAQLDNYMAQWKYLQQDLAQRAPGPEGAKRDAMSKYALQYVEQQLQQMQGYIGQIVPQLMQQQQWQQEFDFKKKQYDDYLKMQQQQQQGELGAAQAAINKAAYAQLGQTFAPLGMDLSGKSFQDYVARQKGENLNDPARLAQQGEARLLGTQAAQRAAKIQEMANKGYTHVGEDTNAGFMRFYNPGTGAIQRANINPGVYGSSAMPGDAYYMTPELSPYQKSQFKESYPEYVQSVPSSKSETTQQSGSGTSSGDTPPGNLFAFNIPAFGSTPSWGAISDSATDKKTALEGTQQAKTPASPFAFNIPVFGSTPSWGA